MNIIKSHVQHDHRSFQTETIVFKRCAEIFPSVIKYFNGKSFVLCGNHPSNILLCGLELAMHVDVTKLISVCWGHISIQVTDVSIKDESH